LRVIQLAGSQQGRGATWQSGLERGSKRHVISTSRLEMQAFYFTRHQDKGKGTVSIDAWDTDETEQILYENYD